MDSFSSGLSGATLSVALTVGSTSLTLSGVPTNLPAGRYPFKIDSELLTGSYGGTGRVFGDLQRGIEQTTPASHRAGVLVRHPIRGDALNQLARMTRLDPHQFVRPAGVRAYLFQTYR
jgi:hypothetical protein